ncbi:MAG: isocitrate/isopropylmalate dehydrogenase family protein [Rhodospirillales bacterium]|nr:MAG: isocitrate/isopropylmalate dehydrogenase family protein [Rhodospirillales bacterium]
MDPVFLAVLPGDGIGPEITEAARRVLRRAAETFGFALDLREAEIGFAALAATGTTCPDSVLEMAREAQGIILGPVSHNDYPPRAEGGINPSGTLRTALDLYANIRPARTRAAIPAPAAQMDLVIVRENTEGFYADRNMSSGPAEFTPVAGVGIAMRKVTAAASARIARSAFALAAGRRRQVVAVHKANVMRLTDGIFLTETRRIAAEHPDIDYSEMLVDAAAAHLIRDPGRFDVIVTTNMFGDILSDEALELAGGLGLGASLNAGDDHAMAQAQHGSAPDIAGRGIANPTSLILSTAMLLDWLAQRHRRADLARAARAIEDAVDRALIDPSTRTADLGGTAGTAAMTDAVLAGLGR